MNNVTIDEYKVWHKIDKQRVASLVKRNEWYETELTELAESIEQHLKSGGKPIYDLKKIRHELLDILSGRP